YDGDSQVGDRALELSFGDVPRPGIYARVLDAFSTIAVRRVIAVPYFRDDAWTAIALHDLLGVPLCTYLMDDANVFASGIPDELMRELLEKSDLRLVISAEMRDAYEVKYRLKCHIVPPVVRADLIRRGPPGL